MANSDDAGERRPRSQEEILAYVYRRGRLLRLRRRILKAIVGALGLALTVGLPTYVLRRRRPQSEGCADRGSSSLRPRKSRLLRRRRGLPA
ncbi:MAG: hypothetical protein WDA71_05275 [Actinomycetota bacterium]